MRSGQPLTRSGHLMRRLRLVLPLLAALAVLVPWWAARRDTANPAPAAAALNLAREQGRAIAALRADLAAYRAETARRRDAAQLELLRGVETRGRELEQLGLLHARPRHEHRERFGLLELEPILLGLPHRARLARRRALL